MNTLEKYVHYVQPVVQTISDQYNPSYLLQYFSVSPDDLFAVEGMVGFFTQDKHLPEHFSGDIPVVYAQWGEETGANIVIQLSAEHRALLSPDVATVLLGEQYKLWEDGVVYLLMGHEYCQTCSGYTVTEQIDPTNGGVGNALDFLSRSLGLDYFLINEGKSDIEYALGE